MTVSRDLVSATVFHRSLVAKMVYRNIAFLAFLYFLQGLPYGLQSRFLPLYFRTRGMSLSEIGFFKLLLVPWMLKAVWAPLVDRYGTKKQWLSYSMLGLLLVCLLGSLTSPEHIFCLGVMLFMFNLITATQDIAVDGLAIQILSISELSSGNIAQVVGYKCGAVFSGGFLIWLFDLLKLSWGTLFIGLGAFYLVAFVIVLKMVPYNNAPKIVHVGDSKENELTDENGTDEDKCVEVQVENKGDIHWIFKHFQVILESNDTKWTLLYVLMYKLGEQGSLTLIPLYLVDHGISAAMVGFWTGVIGQTVSIFGSILGGWLVSYYRYTPHQVVLCFSKLRLVPLTVYIVIIILWDYTFTVSPQMMFVSMVLWMSVMLLGSGIITTTTFTLMMFCSQRSPSAVQASHYTVMATIEVLGKLVFSVVIGSFADIFGYCLTFSLFVLLGLAVIPILYRCPKNIVDMDCFCTSNKNC